jgi:ATP/maltotriose-dependent transcriptional regulator MalT
MQSQLGKLFFFLGAYDQAALYHQQGSLVGNDNFHGLDNSIHLGLAQAVLGDLPAGLRLANEAISHSERKGLTMFNLSAQLVKAFILLSSGAFQEAQSMLEFTKAEAQRRSLAEIQIQSALLLAKHAFCIGQVEQTARLCKDAVAEASAISHLILAIEGCTLWLKVSRQGNLETCEAQHALQMQVQQLAQQVSTPNLKHLLVEKYKIVDIFI